MASRSLAIHVSTSAEPDDRLGPVLRTLRGSRPFPAKVTGAKTLSPSCDTNEGRATLAWFLKNIGLPCESSAREGTMGLECLLVICLAVIGGIYGIFWVESRKNGPEARHPEFERANRSQTI
jgi:hypothetical protein